jgi:eukaryotic-like serine/threonine-protein kinase
MAKARLEAGSVIGGFKIGERIHKGGMADIWAVTRGRQSRPKLMKIPVLFEGEDPAAIVGFEMEQMIMPRLKGVHVPRFVANGDFKTQPYIVMERVAGTTLELLLEHLPLAVDEVVAIAAKIADALDSLHRQGVIHLDLKPSNIIFRETGEAVLIDFGLSHHRDLPDLMAEEFHVPYGTAPYMAPEQVLGVRNDPRSDLFALGCLMYYLATGAWPFGDPQRLRGLKQRLWRDPVPPRKLKPDLPPWFQEVVLRCLEVHAGRRHQSAAQLGLDLRNASHIELTARAARMKQDSFFAVLRRKSEPEFSHIDRPAETMRGLSDAPIVAVAVDLDQSSDELSAALRRTVTRILECAPAARLACVNVLKLARVALDTTLDDEGNNKHVQRLVALKDWAHALHLAPGKVTFHVLEAIDPAEAILEYTRFNKVDHIVMGAGADSALRQFLGSVAGKVAAEAPCTVTVVRSRHFDA